MPQVEERWLWDFWDLAPFRHLERKGAPLRFATQARTSSTLRLWNRNIRNLPTLTTARGLAAWLASLHRRPSIEQHFTVEATGDLLEERPKTPDISWADRQTIFGQIGSRHRAIFERARREGRSLEMTDYQAMVENFDRAEHELEARARRSTA